MKNDLHSKAVRNLGVNRLFRHGENQFRLACLVRDEDLRPLWAPWWKGKEVCLIAADLTGNFFLRHCDGSIRYWDHSSQTEITVSPSVKDFVSRLEYDAN